MSYPCKKLVFVTVILLTACSVQEKTWESVSPVFVPEKAKQFIQTTRVLISVDRDSRMGIPVMGQRTSHQYFGVLGKLAESATSRFKDDLAAEHRHLLRGVDKAAFKFDSSGKFRETAEQKLRNIDWLKVSNVVNQYDIPLNEIGKIVRTQDEDVLLFIDNRFLMSYDFRSIIVFSHVALYANNDQLVEIAKKARPYENPPTLYKNLFLYEYHYDKKYTTADDALGGWSNNNGEMVRRAIAESISDLTNQISTDLSFITVAK